MRSNHAIDTSIAIRADGSATIVEYDEDGASSTVNIENPDGIDMRIVVGQIMSGELVMPRNVRKLFVSRSEGVVLTTTGQGADVINLAGRNAS